MRHTRAASLAWYVLGQCAAFWFAELAWGDASRLRCYPRPPALSEAPFNREDAQSVKPAFSSLPSDCVYCVSVCIWSDVHFYTMHNVKPI
jgi:hypothetical protein